MFYKLFFYLNYSLRTASESAWLQQKSLMVLKSSSWRKEDSYIQGCLQRFKELSGWKMCYWLVTVWKMKWLKADASVEVGYRQTDSYLHSPLLSALIQSAGLWHLSHPKISMGWKFTNTNTYSNTHKYTSSLLKPHMLVSSLTHMLANTGKCGWLTCPHRHMSGLLWTHTC